MRRWLLSFVLASAAFQAQAVWFTVVGDPERETAETVQVDPVALMASDGVRTMELRVNRAQQRRNWEGVPYRSYESQVTFDCERRRAAYLKVTYYDEPLWQGTPSTTTDYASAPQPMRFRDMAPNPTERIIRAACRTRTD